MAANCRQTHTHTHTHIYIYVSGKPQQQYGNPLYIYIYIYIYTHTHTYIHIQTADIYLIYKDGCLYVSLYLIQIHISEPIGTKLCTRLPRHLEEAVGYVWAHNISPFPPFRPISLGASAHSCAVHGRRCHTAPLLRYLHDATCAGVTSRTVRCAMLMERSERNACA